MNYLNDDTDWDRADVTSNLEGNRVNDSIPTLDLNSATRRRLSDPWKYCLIGKVMNKTVGFRYIQEKTNSMWKPFKQIKILDLGKDFFFQVL